MLLTSALTCLALNIYNEARGEPIVGQHAVAQVTMNRAKRDPKSVCKAVLEKGQFSWVDVAVDKSGGIAVVRKGSEPKDAKAWSTAKQIANDTLNGWVTDFTHGATFYHSKKVAPAWTRARGVKMVAAIGSHRFYRVT